MGATSNRGGPALQAYCSHIVDERLPSVDPPEVEYARRGDVWALVGTSHWRRRGMTFDEGADMVTMDRDLDDRGASRRIRTFRRSFLGSRLQVPPDGAASADAIRLASPAGAFDLVHDLVAQEGLGRVRPFWRGPTDSDVLAQSHDVADPDGASDDQYLVLFAGLIGESP